MSLGDKTDEKQVISERSHSYLWHCSVLTIILLLPSRNIFELSGGLRLNTISEEALCTL